VFVSSASHLAGGTGLRFIHSATVDAQGCPPWPAVHDDGAMAAIDSLLKVIGSRDAELLRIATGEVPVLQRRGEDASLSMPALDAPLVAQFVDEVVPPGQRAQLDEGGSFHGRYESDAGSFSVQVRRFSQGYRLAFQPIGATAAQGAPMPAAPTRAPAPAAPPPASPPAGPPAHAPARGAMAHGGFAAAADLDALSDVLRQAEAEDASDVILSTGSDARLRVCGQLLDLPGTRCTEDALLTLFAHMVDAEGRRTLEIHGSLDGILDQRPLGGGRYRVNLFRQQLGLAAALRPIRTRIPTLQDLALPDDLYELTRYPSGLVLVTGQAGSGKSTTLTALTEHINRTRPSHVITLEDPIEYEYASQRSLVHQRGIGTHVESFAAGLRAALRESPDVIVLGEMRDLDTISAALTAAETGHLVLSTLHCGGAAVAIDRIVDVFPPHQQQQIRHQLSSVLRAVITQVLLPSTTPPKRVPAIEKMVVNAAIAAMIRESRSHQIASQIQTGGAAGMIPLDRSLAALVRSKKITRDTARTVAVDPDGLRALGA
jgi:twitching motility protein PilT